MVNEATSSKRWLEINTEMTSLDQLHYSLISVTLHQISIIITATAPCYDLISSDTNPRTSVVGHKVFPLTPYALFGIQEMRGVKSQLQLP